MQDIKRTKKKESSFGKIRTKTVGLLVQNSTQFKMIVLLPLQNENKLSKNSQFPNFQKLRNNPVLQRQRLGDHLTNQKGCLFLELKREKITH